MNDPEAAAGTPAARRDYTARRRRVWSLLPGAALVAAGVGSLALALVVANCAVGEAPEAAQAPVVRGLAPGEEPPDCVFRPDGSIILGSGPTLCFDPRQVAVGQAVRVTASAWNDEFPVEFFLVTEEQRELSGWAQVEADLVRLGELDLEGGEVSFAFTLASSFRTVEGNSLEVLSGDRLFLMALQHTNAGSGAHTTGPLVVR